MKILGFSRYALTSCAAAGMLAGCGGSGAPSVPPLTSGSAVRVEGDGSWMATDAASHDLLYVTGLDDVTVFSYPGGELKGILTGFDSPVGDCVDKAGNIFVTNQIPAKIYEYAHGGSKRIATLQVNKTEVEPVGCAIDPMTGNLATTGFSSGAEVFKGARGKPIFYKDKGFYDMEFCAYDDKGDLFVNGNMTMKRSALVELQKGTSTFTDITLDTPTNHVGGVQWTGKRLAIGGFYPLKSANPVIYRYLIADDHGTKTGTTPLAAPAYEAFQFLIDGLTVLVPNWAETGGRPYSVLFYNFPRGGTPLRQIRQRIEYPRGVVSSRAS